MSAAAADILSRIEATAPVTVQADWDASGVQIAGTRERIGKLAVTLDPTPAAVRSALEWGADFILCHHPLTLSPRLPARLDGYHDVLRMILASGAWLYAAHTSLDCQPQGPVSWLCARLGLENLRVLEPISTGAMAGFGQVGTLPEQLSYDDFTVSLSAVSELGGRGFWLGAGRTPDLVTTVAVCPGSGAALASMAFGLGADVFITGDLKFHQAQESEGHIIDVGHFVLEETMMRSFRDQLAEDLEPLGVEIAFVEGREPLSLRLLGA